MIPRPLIALCALGLATAAWAETPSDAVRAVPVSPDPPPPPPLTSNPAVDRHKGRTEVEVAFVVVVVVVVVVTAHHSRVEMRPIPLFTESVPSLNKRCRKCTHVRFTTSVHSAPSHHGTGLDHSCDRSEGSVS